jgi:hypothetical protein
VNKFIQYALRVWAYLLDYRRSRRYRVGKPVIAGDTLVFIPALAAAIGTNEALIVQKVFEWMHFNAQSGRRDHFLQNRWWTYNSYVEWHEKEFTWMSLATVKRLFQKLKKQGILIGRQQRRNDPRLWYTVNQTVLEGYLKESPSGCKRVPDRDSSRQRGNRKSPPSNKKSSKGNHMGELQSTNIINQPLDDDVMGTEPETGEIDSTGEAARAVSLLEGDGRDRQPPTTPSPVPASPSPAAALLAAQGVTEPALSQLVEQYSEMDIVQAVAYMGRQKQVDHPPGWLVDCLRDGWHQVQPRPRTAPQRRREPEYVPGQYDDFLQT